MLALLIYLNFDERSEYLVFHDDFLNHFNFLRFRIRFLGFLNFVFILWSYCTQRYLSLYIPFLIVNSFRFVVLVGLKLELCFFDNSGHINNMVAIVYYFNHLLCHTLSSRLLIRIFTLFRVNGQVESNPSFPLLLYFNLAELLYKEMLIFVYRVCVLRLMVPTFILFWDLLLRLLPVGMRLLVKIGKDLITTSNRLVLGSCFNKVSLVWGEVTCKFLWCWFTVFIFFFD